MPFIERNNKEEGGSASLGLKWLVILNKSTCWEQMEYLIFKGITKWSRKLGFAVLRPETVENSKEWD